MKAKPILFSTDMVRAILEERKTVTRRPLTPQPAYAMMTKAGLMTSDNPIRVEDGLVVTERGTVTRTPWEAGDILYVRETWGNYATYTNPDGADYFMYRADYPDGAATTTYPDGTVFDLPTWRPSIHMPKEAARIFLRVTDVRVERLQDITEEQAKAEGFGSRAEFLEAFLAMYPDCTEESWAWVIEFERVEKPEGWAIC